MECTQRLECTQHLYETHSQRCPEEIGFLGICGTKYPVKKGPNKIGRDPQMCSIVLNLNSISRQHAVINILSNNNNLIMDLDSANKTRCGDKTLQAYIPHPLKDGDTVQFGDVFGIFRLLEQDDDLPMTQAIDIPETPVSNHYVSRINKVPITMVPESPDVSDKEDSFVAPSQKDAKKEPNNHFVRPSSKTICIQPIGSNKIDNVYWNSSKKSKSLSLSLNNSNANLDSSDVPDGSTLTCASNDIHEMDTQDPFSNKIDTPSAIYAAETQMPEAVPQPSIFSQDTQVVPTTLEHNMPSVQRINNMQHELNLYASNRENKHDLYDAETQVFQIEEPNVSGTPSKKLTEDIRSACNDSNNKLNLSNDVIVFDETYSQCLDSPFESQSLLPEDEMAPSCIKSIDIETNKNKMESGCIEIVNKRINRVKSSDSTDAEDIILSQVIPRTKDISDEDVTDCEEVENNLITEIADKTNKKSGTIKGFPAQIIVTDESNKDKEGIEHMATQVLAENKKTENCITVKNREEEIDFEELATQIIVEDINPNKSIDKNIEEEINYEDLPTQILVEDIQPITSMMRDRQEDVNMEDLPTQIIDKDIPKNQIGVQLPEQEYSEEITPSFKIPLQAPKKSKLAISTVKDEVMTIEDDQYYQSTQDIYSDLMSQEQCTSENIGNNKKKLQRKSNVDDMSPSSVIDCIIGYSAPNKQTPKKLLTEKLFDNDDDTKRSNSSNKQKKVDGVSSIKKIKRISSDNSDVDATPKKRTALKFTESDLPNSQEIKKFVKSNKKHDIDDYSSDSETENSQEDALPLFNKRKKRKIDAKLDLTEKLKNEALPTRVITRVRKPTLKVSTSIFKPNFLTEKEAGIDQEIMAENISRLKTIIEKSKTHKKESTKVLDKSSINNEKETQIQDVRKETSKLSNGKLNENSTSDISRYLTRKELRKTSPSIESKSTNKTTRDRKKDNSTKKANEHKSTKNVKVEKTTGSKTSNTLLEESQVNDKSKTSLNSTTESNQSSRTTRRSKKDKVNCSVTPEREADNVKSTKRTYRKRTRKTPEKDQNQQISLEPVVEPRRSKRILAVPPKIKSILKPSLGDQSAVYNKSSESVTESPKKFKRSAEVKELQVPSPKRTRSAIDQNSSLRPPKTHYVLFTTFPTQGVQDKLEKLGAVTVSEVSACTVLLTTGLRRTFKLLCAVGLGRPVVGPAWVQACVDTNTIVDPWMYLLKDEETEKRFHFDLERTLLGKRNYLRGFTVSSTPSVMPPAKEMKQIVECSGGVWREGGARWVVVSTPRDSALWPALRRRGARLVSSEFVLAGVFRQIPDLESYLYQ